MGSAGDHLKALEVNDIVEYTRTDGSKVEGRVAAVVPEKMTPPTEAPENVVLEYYKNPERKKLTPRPYHSVVVELMSDGPRGKLHWYWPRACYVKPLRKGKRLW